MYGSKRLKSWFWTVHNAFLGLKNQNFEISLYTFFLIHLTYLQSKNQLHSTYRTWEKCTESKSQKSHFKVRGPIFGENQPIFTQNFQKSSKLTTFCGFICFSPPSYMKNHQKPSLKPFLAPENRYLDHFSLYFFIINLYWKSPISAIPGRSQMLALKWPHSGRTQMLDIRISS